MTFLRPVPAEVLAPLDASGAILSFIARGQGLSRAELIHATALSRATLGQRLGALLASGLVCEADTAAPSRGRPSRLLTLAPGAALILVADMGERNVRIAVADLGPRILAQETIPFAISDGPAATLARIAEVFDQLTARLGSSQLIAGVGISLPAPVDHRIGRVFGPSILVGWDDFPIGDWLAQRFGAPAIVENDVNLMTVFEQRRSNDPTEQLLFLKIGTGIGSGIMTEGRLYRGAQGAAGDIGHMQVLNEESLLCRCGKFGCLEAQAAGWALARDLRALGIEAQDAKDVVALVESNTPEAIELLGAAGHAIGIAVSDTVAILNPGRIVIGGTLARVGEHLLTGMREMIHQRCLPLATRDLMFDIALPVEQACLLGAAHSVMERVFAPSTVDRLLARYRAWLEAEPA